MAWGINMKTRLFIVTLDGRTTYVGGTKKTALPKVKQVIRDYLDESKHCVSLEFKPKHMQSFSQSERLNMASIAELDSWQLREIVNEIKDIDDLHALPIFGNRLSVTEHYLM